MSDLDKDQTQTEPKSGQRKHRQIKRLPKTTVRLLVVLAAVVVVVIIIVVSVTASSRGGDVAAYQKYISGVSGIVKQSDSMGKELGDLLLKPEETTRKDIQAKLDQYILKAETLANQAADLKPPVALTDNGASQFFLLVMQFRYKGLQSLKPSLLNALEQQDVDVASQGVANALAYLTTSDFLYREVYIERTTGVLKQKNLAGVTVPSSQFLSDPDLASQSRVKDLLAVLKSTSNLQAVHGVAITKVVEKPSGKAIADGGTYNLASTDSLSFAVTVENQGNLSEKVVPVTLELSSPDSTDTQKKVVTIPEIKPKEQLTVTITGLNPTPYGERWTLQVTVGPVPGEKVKDNNSIEASVIFML
jgi:hypothetical protein